MWLEIEGGNWRGEVSQPPIDVRRGGEYRDVGSKGEFWSSRVNAKEFSCCEVGLEAAGDADGQPGNAVLHRQVGRSRWCGGGTLVFVLFVPRGLSAVVM